MPRGLNEQAVEIHQQKAPVSFELKHYRNMKVRVDTEDTGLGDEQVKYSR